MKKCSWLAGSLAICSCFGMEATAAAAAVKQQSEVGKEIAAEIGKTHGIWGGFIDYAVLAALVLALLALLWIWYVHHVIGQRLEKAFAQKKYQEPNQPNMAIHVQSFDGSRDIDVMKKEIRELKENVCSLEKRVNDVHLEARDKQNVNTGIETTNTNEPLYANKKYTSLGEVAYDETKADDFIREYNALYDIDGMGKKRKQTALENDSLLRRFGCSNNEARLYNPDIEPIFKSSQDGEYIAYNVGNNHYAVLPAYATYEKTKHVMYAMGDVFDSNYAGEAYTKIEVVRPAIFVVSDDKWKLKRKGKLVLNK